MPLQDRAITMREAALLQGLPRNYKFPKTSKKTAIALMIGNALPPEFIKRHALEIRNCLHIIYATVRSACGLAASNRDASTKDGLP